MPFVEYNRKEEKLVSHSLLYNIGDVVDDMKILELPHYRNSGYLVECTVCGRQKRMRGERISNHVATTHTACNRSDSIVSDNKRFHAIWAGIRSRTTNPNSRSYKDYGARGISSEEFTNYVDFYDMMYQSYCEAVEKYGDESLITIERIDVNGDYTHDNLTWIPKAQQSTNKRNTIHCIAQAPSKTIYRLQSLSLTFLSEHNLNRNAVYNCLKRKAYTHKAWIFYYENTDDEYISLLNAKQDEQIRLIEAVSPSDDIYHFKYMDLLQFCKRFNLRRPSVIRVLNGAYQQYKGWRFCYKQQEV